jgi:PIN domain nuclease of toxin-antitoxin system
VLLDAPALLGVLFASFPIGPHARAAIVAPANAVFVSPVSAYEIEWKRANGKLRMPSIPDWETALITRGYLVAGLTITHFVEAATLPRHHRDPWDRLLVAQAKADGFVIASPDAMLPAYGVATLW